METLVYTSLWNKWFSHTNTCDCWVSRHFDIGSNGYHSTYLRNTNFFQDTIIVDLDNRTVKSQNTIQIPERSKLINIAQKFVDADSIDQERIMSTFLEFFASLVGDYRLYLAPDGFDLHAFLEAHEPNKEFLNEFTQTAHWRHFINTKIESLKCKS